MHHSIRQEILIYIWKFPNGSTVLIQASSNTPSYESCGCPSHPSANAAAPNGARSCPLPRGKAAPALERLPIAPRAHWGGLLPPQSPQHPLTHPPACLPASLHPSPALGPGASPPLLQISSRFCPAFQPDPRSASKASRTHRLSHSRLDQPCSLGRLPGGQPHAYV